ncbi:hypothetical protein IMZ11_29780 [Microtetraspora sp. AC03309]|uniref:hypothetical protein n=1 Tax=Microtetraspora sp. AC03309 TaxID=2779376 RepID=UPI001E5BF0B6|nr:hypothetical protein [Microtetraspora sp. AC03309]MCC5579823.1 hypothetical protein [Microtetraspora sp. AC03309]
MAEAGDVPREAFTTPMPRLRPEDAVQAGQSPERHEPPAAWGFRDRGGGMPLRLVYAVLAGVGTVVAIALVFVVFSGDRPEAAPGPVHQGRPAGTPGASPSAVVSPTPVVRLPRVPAARSMVVHPGEGTPTAAFVVDERSGIGYAGFGRPWRKADPAPFAYAQRAGRALIASSPMPGAVPEALTTYAAYRKVATRAAKWTLRLQPDGGTLTWTASQPLRRGMGWLLGYRLTYLVDGRRHSSEAIVAVVGTSGTSGTSGMSGTGGRSGKKPALLFATVPDTRAELYHDLNMLFWTLRPM